MEQTNPVHSSGDRGRISLSLLVIAIVALPGTTAPADDALKPAETPALATAGHELTGIVLAPDGQPAAGAQVAIANWTVEVQLQRESLSFVGTAAKSGLKIARTDASGHFRLPPQHDPQVLVIAHQSGYVEVDDPRARRDPKANPAAQATGEFRITLQKWGRVIGNVRIGEKPVEGAQFRLGSVSTKAVRRIPLRASHIVQTDANGRFFSLRVPPGAAWCQRVIANPRRNEALLRENDVHMLGWITHFDVPPGESVKLDLAAPGVTITGRFLMPPDDPSQRKWSEARIEVNPHYEGIRNGRPEFQMQFANRRQGQVGAPDEDPQDEETAELFSVARWEELLKSPEGRYRNRGALRADADGRFRIEDLPPNDYVLKINFPESPNSDAFYLRVAAPRRGASDQPIDVGQFQLQNRQFGFTRSPKFKEPDEPDLAKMERPDPVAKTLALKSFAKLTAVDHLPRFYYHTVHGRGPVMMTPYRKTITLENIRQALDDAVVARPFLHSPTVVAWDGRQTLLVHANEEDSPDEVEKGRWTRTWNEKEAWERFPGFDKQLYFTLPRSAQPDSEALATRSCFFEAIPHQFWWGGFPGNSLMGSYIPPEDAEYFSRGTEIFDGESCDVVESTSRLERLWISRGTGLIRGVLHYAYFQRDGVRMRDYFRFKAIREITGRTFMDRQEFNLWEWLHGTPEQRRQMHLLDLESRKEMRQPLQLYCFRDYREVTPGIHIPFREDSVLAWPEFSLPGHFKFHRVWVVVDDVRLNMNLANMAQRLLPKDGDKIDDQRFAFPLKYDFNSNRLPNYTRQLVTDQWHEGKIDHGRFAGYRVSGVMQKLYSPASKLPEAGWINGKAPDVKGKPYLLHFFAEWNKYGWTEFAALRKLADEGAIVIGAHPGNSKPDSIDDFIKARELNYPIVVDKPKGAYDYDQSILGYEVRVLPYAILVNQRGQVVAHGAIDANLLTKFRELRAGVSKTP